jgi:hypothetical protein
VPTIPAASSEARARLALSILDHRLAALNLAEKHGAERAAYFDAAVEDAARALAGMDVDVIAARSLARAL